MPPCDKAPDGARGVMGLHFAWSRIQHGPAGTRGQLVRPGSGHGTWLPCSNRCRSDGLVKT